jgi:hypothetical protein
MSLLNNKSLITRLMKLEDIIREKMEAEEDKKLTWEEGSLEWAYLQGCINDGEISEEEAEQIRKECNESDDPLMAIIGHPVLMKLTWEDWDQEEEGL